MPQEARFCTSCGASLQSPACARCGQLLPEGARFCTGCGAHASPAGSAQEETALANAIAALGLALSRSDPRKVLRASLDALAKAPSTEPATVACLTAMSACAQLGDFEQAKSHLLKARSLFAAHLGLTDQQGARFIADGVLIGDLIDVGNKSAQETPWLYFIMGHACGPILSPTTQGLLASWSDFIHYRREQFIGMLAFLCWTNKQYPEAAGHLETLTLIARRYESTSPVRIELLWPLVPLGDCYWRMQDQARAVSCWQRARAVELCIEPNFSDDWGRLGLPWIEHAKSRLAERNIAIPSREASHAASEFLRLAVRYQMEAEQFENRDAGLDELVDGVRRAGQKYVGLIERAGLELEKVRQADPFAWTYNINCWWRYETVKAYLLRKTAFVHLSREKLALAIVACKQEMEIWPTLSSGALMGGLQVACSLKADAGATYRMCIDRAEAFGATESSADRDQIVTELKTTLRELAL